jgi:hypothetical protein
VDPFARTTGTDFSIGNATVPISCDHAARASVCRCCGCGHVGGNALALSIMSTDWAATAPTTPSHNTAIGVE